MEDQPSCNCHGCQAHQQIMTWQGIAFERLQEICALKTDTITYHDENTLFKVREALVAAGIPKQNVLNAISQMQNAGIYFRERQPDALSDEGQMPTGSGGLRLE